MTPLVIHLLASNKNDHQYIISNWWQLIKGPYISEFISQCNYFSENTNSQKHYYTSTPAEIHSNSNKTVITLNYV